MNNKNRTKIEKINNKNEWLQNKRNLDKEDNSWIRIDIEPWGGTYKPVTLAAVSYDDNGLNVYMRSYEKKIRFTGVNRNDFVCQDSCMEFFFAPMGPDNLAYFNFEVNPVGVMYIGFSDKGNRSSSKQAAADKVDNYFEMKAMSRQDAENYNEINKDNEEAYWDISYSIPFDLIKEYIPEFTPNVPGKIIPANFYKCGDLTDIEHYVVWNNIETPKPDYHVPEYFGGLEL